MVEVAHYLSRGTTEDAQLSATVDLINAMRATAGQMLPGADFTEQQKAMAMLPMPLR